MSKIRTRPPTKKTWPNQTGKTSGRLNLEYEAESKSNTCQSANESGLPSGGQYRIAPGQRTLAWEMSAPGTIGLLTDYFAGNLSW